MKIIELDVHNVRGICCLSLKPDGKNFVVWGPNGSGKSAVVDAIDFLLTGRISRLTGKGTGGITLNRYGPHIDHKLEDATVRAVIQLPGVKEPVEIRRCMAHPTKLECNKPPSQLDAAMNLARRGQHVLTRREILKYIAAEAGTRSQEIQELLNVTEIGEIRKAFVKVQNDLRKEFQDAIRTLNTAEGSVNATVQEKMFKESSILQVVNQNRVKLGGQPVFVLHSTELKADLKPPGVIVSDNVVNTTLLQRYLKNLIDVAELKSQEKIAEVDNELRSLINAIRSDPQLLRSLKRLELIKWGLSLIDESGNCPLCDTPWSPGELTARLEKQLSIAEDASKNRERINVLSKTITDSANATIASIQKVINDVQAVNLKTDVAVLQSWLKQLFTLTDSLSTPVEKYPDAPFTSTQVQQMLVSDEALNSLYHIVKAIKSEFPETTPEQTAWDTLTRLEENLKNYEDAQSRKTEAELFHKRSTILLESFQRSSDAVLGKLYDNIKDRFVILYRQIHNLDEDNFTATIEPEGAGLNLGVDFYGRGIHPPLALHSEGHQDSMGLCLYLALSEKLTVGLINLTILDDVVMSVDADHRRDLCRLLATNFHTRQFLITTHDKTWAYQLKSEGVVSSRGMIEFNNWHVETGPLVNYEVDMWQRLKTDFKKNDITSAAARLRRGSEEFFSMVCDALHAPVTFKLNARWELGDFLPAAMSRYRSLLKQAKNSAQSWGDTDRFNMLNKLDSSVAEIYSHSQAEQWAINANVHYNNWANFGKEDFCPVLKAFKDLFRLFQCNKCRGLLRTTFDGGTQTAVKCKCGYVNWNLIVKGK